MLVLFQKTLLRLAHSKSVQCPKFILLEECRYFFEDFFKRDFVASLYKDASGTFIKAFCLVTFRYRPKLYSVHTIY